MTVVSAARQKAAALVLAPLLVAGWSLVPAMSSAGASSEASRVAPVRVPTQSIMAPATVSRPGQISLAVPLGSGRRLISAVNTNGIPAAALAAYQRAAQVIDSADPGCGLGWPLIAAIGRVESDHGRYAGSLLSADGVSTPGIFGRPLNGRSGTQRINDTDAGQYDRDRRFDRAVGPMQFIPSTWSVVGVDADGDKRRNPQDIDDAALATAVYLCSGNEDLGTDGGRTSAVYRYNHSTAYVKLVNLLAAAYTHGEYTSLPTSSYAPTYLGPLHDDSFLATGAVGARGKLSGLRPDQGSTKPKALTSSAVPSDTPDAPGDGGKRDDAKVPAKGLKDISDAIPQTLSDLQSAAAYCQANLTAAQIDLLGGIGACSRAYVDGGATVISDLINKLGLGGLITGLIPKH